ncbi:hypothetical protein HK405_007761 [Cladochytrium tenue]|nr:hypothetical protein HK405_007761 [Cladochytrium tenue]
MLAARDGASLAPPPQAPQRRRVRAVAAANAWVAAAATGTAATAVLIAAGATAASYPAFAGALPAATVLADASSLRALASLLSYVEQSHMRGHEHGPMLLAGLAIVAVVELGVTSYLDAHTAAEAARMSLVFKKRRDDAATRRQQCIGLGQNSRTAGAAVIAILAGVDAFAPMPGVVGAIVDVVLGVLLLAIMIYGLRTSLRVLRLRHPRIESRRVLTPRSSSNEDEELSGLLDAAKTLHQRDFTRRPPSDVVFGATSLARPNSMRNALATSKMDDFDLDTLSLGTSLGGLSPQIGKERESHAAPETTGLEDLFQKSISLQADRGDDRVADDVRAWARRLESHAPAAVLICMVASLAFAAVEELAGPGPGLLSSAARAARAAAGFASVLSWTGLSLRRAVSTHAWAQMMGAVALAGLGLAAWYHSGLPPLLLALAQLTVWVAVSPPTSTQ